MLIPLLRDKENKMKALQALSCRSYPKLKDVSKLLAIKKDKKKLATRDSTISTSIHALSLNIDVLLRFDMLR